MTAWIKNQLSQNTDIALAFGVVSILFILFVPIHPAILDTLLITNFSIAILILLLTFYVDKPIDFSTFPSLILIATLFRLALNISATRLILSDADAGNVINSVGEHVVGGNYIIGIIVFLVLVVVQYVVVTNGAQRVAEVAARFTLDSMPGKQMSIDADLNAGLIDEDTARIRRLQIDKEGSFYGAMDGASKFVKGDAIAGILIILIDIIGGLAIGVAQMGMKWGEAAEVFTLLTIGDGIVTQIPALIISTATGIIVTRASSDKFLSKEIGMQVTAYPKTLIIVTFMLLLVMMVPGIPFIPVFIIVTIFASLSFLVIRQNRKKRLDEDSKVESSMEKDESDAFVEIYKIRPVELKVGEDVSTLFKEEDSSVFNRISSFRKLYAADYGFVLPKITVSHDEKLKPHEYVILINGATIAKAEIFLDKLLVISQKGIELGVPGNDTTDPTYGLPAKWVDPRVRNDIDIKIHTVVESETVLITHIVETLKRSAKEFLTRIETERLTELVRHDAANLVDELIPNVLTVGQLQTVLQILVKEKVPIHNLQVIFEVLVEAGKSVKEPDRLAEFVRQKLSAHISQSLTKGTGKLSVLTLDGEMEVKLAQSIVRSNESEQVVIEPKLMEQLLKGLSARVEDMIKDNFFPVLLTAPEVRRHIKRMTERTIPQLTVISLLEVSENVELSSYATVKI